VKCEECSFHPCGYENDYENCLFKDMPKFDIKDIVKAATEIKLKEE